MRKHVALGVFAVTALGISLSGQGGKHLNPVVDLLAARKPVFGTSIPANGGGGGGNRGGGGGAAGGGAATTAPPPAATPAPAPKTPLELAKDALAHPENDYFFTGGMERNVSGPGRNGGPSPIDAFTTFADALVEAGGITTKPAVLLRAPIAAKTINISNAERPADPAVYIENISKQLNAGISIINFVEVDNVDEITKGINAMRFASKGGTRPDAIGNAAKYWGVDEKTYRAKADVWPLNPDGNLLAWAIIETKEGVEKVREIAQVKGLSAVIVGAGTLGGVYSTTNPDGSRGPRDNEAWEAAIQKILAACKEFKKPCGYPAFDNDIEARMKQGFDVFIIQTFSDRGFKAVEIGRQVGGRK
jgi:2-keto-3-deoxy-L-rhamnonate aldolase RhmA